jgi:hypothetical protein
MKGAATTGASAFASTIPNKIPVRKNAPNGMVWIRRGVGRTGVGFFSSPLNALAHRVWQHSTSSTTSRPLSFPAYGSWLALDDAVVSSLATRQKGECDEEYWSYDFRYSPA